MTRSILILGRQPALGLAELESLYGKQLEPLGNQAAALDVDPKDVTFNRLGGTIKLAKLITSINSTDWSQIVKHITTALPQYLAPVPDGKIRFGISIYGLPTKPATINRSGLEIKKIIKRSGRSVRIVPNTAPELNTAQVIHNQLTGPTGMELLLIRHGKKTILAQTVKVQDINAYAARDQKRPKRDARVGMLPPKLAQIIVNLASPAAGTTVLDPFCGTGVILQEALLMGFYAYGTDIERRMFEYATTNIEWLGERFHFTADNYRISIGDATQNEWVKPIDAVACETYLGRPFSALPAPDVLQHVMQDVDTIHHKFLRNLAKQTKPGTTMCIAMPAWKTPYGFKHLKVLDSLEELGYTRRVFVHANNRDLVYHRSEQIVGRELVVLIRK